MFRGLALFMNIPRVEHPARTFTELRSVAQYVSTELNGSLVDPDGVILSAAQFDSIRRQIQSIEWSMKKYGVEPGSDEARRLF
jgi:FtsZ-interacting cell division protein ZipA